VNNLIEDTQLYPKSWLDHLERMDRNSYPDYLFNMNSRDDEMLEDSGIHGNFKNTLSFKIIGLKV
jgi:hypothetical protein